MKGWTSARISGRCSYDGNHRWQAGDRVFVVKGQTWEKHYCPACAKQQHGAGEDTGEYLGDVQDAPNFPSGLRPVSEMAERFDARMAAAGKDPD